MEKRRFPDKELPDLDSDFKLKPSGLSGKLSDFSRRGFNVIKFILGLLFLPFVYSASVAFLNEFGLIEKSLQGYFLNGIISFLVVYLFIWEPAKIYSKGQRLLEVVFNFFKPLVRFAPYLLPIYVIILFVLYELLALVIKSPWLIQYFLFLLGFSFALHIIFSAKTARSKKGDFLKGNYIFGFSFIYVLNIALLSFFLNLLFKEFSIVNFLNNSNSIAKNIFSTVLSQLFLR